GIRVHLPWLPDLLIMSGRCENCSCIKSLLRLGSSPSDEDDLAKELERRLRSPNDHEGVLANILCLIRLCPNDHEGVLVRSLEHVHRLVGFYRFPRFHLKICRTFTLFTTNF